MKNITQPYTLISANVKCLFTSITIKLPMFFIFQCQNTLASVILCHGAMWSPTCWRWPWRSIAATTASYSGM